MCQFIRKVWQIVFNMTKQMIGYSCYKYIRYLEYRCFLRISIDLIDVMNWSNTFQIIVPLNRNRDVMLLRKLFVIQQIALQRSRLQIKSMMCKNKYSRKKEMHFVSSVMIWRDDSEIWFERTPTFRWELISNRMRGKKNVI